MKEKILLFIIGVLVGSIISTGAFYIYTITNNSNSDNNIQMNGGEPPEMPNGEKGNRPEMPNGEQGEPPVKPEDNNSNQG